MDNYISKIGLGSVQFGLDYGISNKKGQPSQNEIKLILGLISQSGIKIIDTAHLYGTSEKILGTVLNTKSSFKIITKTIPIKKNKISTEDIDLVKLAFTKSLIRLNRNKIYGLLLHNANDLKSDGADLLYSYLVALKKERIINKIGVSFYDNEQINYVLKRFKIDIAQIPINIFDQRLINNGGLKKLKDHNVEIHVRSAFLQGAVFMKPDQLPNHLKGLIKPLETFRSLIEQTRSTPSGAALAFLLKQDSINKVICGINNIKQAHSLIHTVSDLPNIHNDLFQNLSVEDPLLVNPSNWKR